MTITHNVQYDAAVVAAAVGYLNCHHRQQLTSIILRQLDTSRICWFYTGIGPATE